MASIKGTRRNDDLSGRETENADVISAGAGNDTAAGGEGNDSIYGETGNDRLKGEAGEDLIDAGRGDDKAYGGAGSDTVLGGRGNDFLWGNDGDDKLDGGRGDDTLSGGIGDDEMAGGRGADLFAFFNGFAGGDGNDVITDFKLSQGDKLDMFDVGITSFDQLSDGDLSNGELGEDDEGNALISYGNDSSVTLEGIAAADVTAGFFNFEEDPGYNRGDFIQS